MFEPIGIRFCSFTFIPIIAEVITLYSEEKIASCLTLAPFDGYTGTEYMGFSIVWLEIIVSCFDPKICRFFPTTVSVSYTHLRAHETDSYLVCRLLLEK